MHRYRLHLAAVCQCCLLGALAGLADSGCGDEASCDLGAITRDLGGVGLIDCGVANAETADVDRCAVAAYRDGSTFRAIYERDDGRLQALVRAAGGDYLVLRQADDDSITRAECNGAQVVADGGRTYVECVDRGPFTTVCE